MQKIVKTLNIKKILVLSILLLLAFVSFFVGFSALGTPLKAEYTAETSVKPYANYPTDHTFNTNILGVSARATLHMDGTGNDSRDLRVELDPLQSGFAFVRYVVTESEATHYEISYIKNGNLYLRSGYYADYDLINQGSWVEIVATNPCVIIFKCSLNDYPITHSLAVGSSVPMYTPHAHANYTFTNITDATGAVFTPQTIPLSSVSMVYTVNYSPNFAFVVTYNYATAFHTDDVNGIQWGETYARYLNTGDSLALTVDGTDTIRFVGWWYKGVLYALADLPLCTESAELTAEYSDVFLAIRFEYVNADGYMVTEKVTHNQFTDVLVAPTGAMDNPNFLDFPNFTEHPTYSRTFKARYKQKKLTVTSALGADVVVVVDYVPYKQALYNMYSLNPTYAKLMLGDDYVSVTIDYHIADEMVKYPNLPWLKCDYYFSYNLDKYMFDKPVLDVDLSNPTYYFHPTDTLKIFFPDYDNSTMFYGGYTADGIVGLPFETFNFIRVVADDSKPLQFDVEVLVYLNVINVDENLVYKVRFNSLKIVDGKALLKINLKDTFALRKEFFGKIEPYNLIGALVYDISVTGATMDIRDNSLYLHIDYDENATEYTVKVGFAKKADQIFGTDVIDDLGNFFDKFKDSFSVVIDFFKGFDLQKWLPLIIVGVVLLFTAPLWLPLIPMLLGLLFKLVAYPVKLIAKAVDKKSKK